MIVILVNVKWYDFQLYFHECFDLHFPQGRMDSSLLKKKKKSIAVKKKLGGSTERKKNFRDGDMESELENCPRDGAWNAMLHRNSFSGLWPCPKPQWWWSHDPLGKARGEFVCGCFSNTIFPAEICLFSLVKTMWTCLLSLPTTFPTQSAHPCHPVISFAFPFSWNDFPSFLYLF